MKNFALAAALAALLPVCASAHDGPHADSHAPLGVMSDHTHEKGEFMLSYRFMHMDMAGNRIGSDSVSPEFIVSNIANPTGAPPNLRVTPLNMTMDMHMVGLMWAPSDRVTLMAMGNYTLNEMEHVTFQGMSGTTRLGRFTTRSEGFGDTKVSALIKLAGGGDQNGGSRTITTVGVSLPTGSINQSDDVLTPMNTNPTLITPYAMQLSTGTFDPFVGLTHARNYGNWGWGAQASATLRVYDNDRDYHRGDEAAATAWATYSPVPALSLSLRAAGRAQGDIKGRDARIAAPVTTADPDNYGGEHIDILAGLNWALQGEALRGHRLALEVGAPVYQNLNGPQLETDYVLTVGWQYS